MPGQAGGAGPGAFSLKCVFAYDPLRPARLPMAIYAWGPLGGVAPESNEPWANAMFGATTEPGPAELGTPRKVAEPAEAPHQRNGVLYAVKFADFPREGGRLPCQYRKPSIERGDPAGIREGLWPYPPASRARQDPKSKISHSGSRFRAPRIHRAAEIQKNFDGPSGRMPALAQGSGGSSGSLDARPPRRPWVAPRPSASSLRLRRFKA